jgi:hypothetical protein
MQTTSLLDTSLKTVADTIAGSPVMSLCILVFAGFGVIVLIQHFRAVPRFDPRLHMERAPIEQQSQRPLPSADAFADWATSRERQPERRGLPWQA